MNNRHWDALKRPPAEALRKITGGRLSGKTDISPQWRVQAMTEHFGPVGLGWRYEIVRLWTEQGADEICAFAQIHLYYRDNGEWSEAIPGIGGSMLVAKEKSGPYVSDEAYKMALTDALSVAMKQLGVAADIYLGLWDGSKYTDDSGPSRQSLLSRAKAAAAIGKIPEDKLVDYRERVRSATDIAALEAVVKEMENHE